jgi:hypothetical protein
MNPHGLNFLFIFVARTFQKKTNCFSQASIKQCRKYLLFLSLLLVIFYLTPPHIVTLQGCFMGKRMENKEERDALIRRIMNIFDTSRPVSQCCYLPLPSSLSPPFLQPHSPLPTTANKEEAQQTPPEPILNPVVLPSLVSPPEPAEEQTPLQIVQTAFTPCSDTQEQQLSAGLPIIQPALPNPLFLPQTIKIPPSPSFSPTPSTSPNPPPLLEPVDHMLPQTTTATAPPPTHSRLSSTHMLVVLAVLVVALAFVWAYVHRT